MEWFPKAVPAIGEMWTFTNVPIPVHWNGYISESLHFLQMVAIPSDTQYIQMHIICYIVTPLQYIYIYIHICIYNRKGCCADLVTTALWKSMFSELSFQDLQTNVALCEAVVRPGYPNICYYFEWSCKRFPKLRFCCFELRFRNGHRLGQCPFLNPGFSLCHFLS